MNRATRRGRLARWITWGAGLTCAATAGCKREASAEQKIERLRAELRAAVPGCDVTVGAALVSLSCSAQGDATTARQAITERCTQVREIMASRALVVNPSSGQRWSWTSSDNDRCEFTSHASPR